MEELDCTCYKWTGCSSSATCAGAAIFLLLTLSIVIFLIEFCAQAGANLFNACQLLSVALQQPLHLSRALIEVILVINGLTKLA